tara:strand:- start:227 stop:469 length:243 start_codon:yes stop_codon:yes gene_type:complete
MIEKLRDLEQEAMDNITPEDYLEITSKVMREEDQLKYQCGYIDGLQTAIRIMSENSDVMSYSVEMEEIFGDEETNEDNGY